MAVRWALVLVLLPVELRPDQRLPRVLQRLREGLAPFFRHRRGKEARVHAHFRAPSRSPLCTAAVSAVAAVDRARAHAPTLILSRSLSRTRTRTLPPLYPRRIQAVGFGIGAFIAMPVLGCPGMTDPDNASHAPLILAIVIAVCVAYKGCMHGCMRGMRLVSPRLHHSSLVMTGASNWVTITYTIPKKPFGCLSKCLGEDKAKPDLATIVLPLKRPTAFIDQAQRQKWITGGLESGYVERRDNIPYGDATHTMYSFNANVEERTLVSLQHTAVDIESSQPLVPQTFRQKLGAATELGLQEMGAENPEEFRSVVGAWGAASVDFHRLPSTYS